MLQEVLASEEVRKQDPFAMAEEAAALVFCVNMEGRVTCQLL